ncbi:MAG TPA: DUF6503 family protein [Saprospiraceae bacterium]|nr:DUF6503 family protein [Saprospiraceae bacterium]
MYIFCTIILLQVSALSSQRITSSEIVKQCIKTHDPRGNWERFKGSFSMTIERDNQATRYFDLIFNNKKRSWQYSYQEDNDQWTYGITKGKKEVFKNRVPLKDYKTSPITDERIQYMHDVYQYLFGVPQILIHDLRYLNPVAKDTLFDGKKVWMLSFDYQNPEKDNWKFFINTTSYQLEGYQFYKISPHEDGEYIILNDWVRIQGILFPKQKIWYWNTTGLFFRKDQIMSYP